MNRTLITAAVALARTLTEENDALRRLDIARAVALFARKEAETRRFVAAQPELHALPPDQLSLARQIAARLADAGDENKRLLERAIAVQGQVIATLLRALPQSHLAPRYGVAGTPLSCVRPISLSSRV